jgi:hypothetical protein
MSYYICSKNSVPSLLIILSSRFFLKTTSVDVPGFWWEERDFAGGLAARLQQADVVFFQIVHDWQYLLRSRLLELDENFRNINMRNERESFHLSVDTSEFDTRSEYFDQTVLRNLLEKAVAKMEIAPVDFTRKYV